MAIEVEEPDTVTAVLVWPGGDRTEVVFTRADYAEIEEVARLEGIEPNEWIMMIAAQSLHDGDGPAALLRRGRLGSA